MSCGKLEIMLSIGLEKKGEVERISFQYSRGSLSKCYYEI